MDKRDLLENIKVKTRRKKKGSYKILDRYDYLTLAFIFHLSQRKTPSNKKLSNATSIPSPDINSSLSEEYQVQIEQLVRTQADMQTELDQCRAQLRAQEQLLQNLLGVLGYTSTGE